VRERDKGGEKRRERETRRESGDHHPIAQVNEIVADLTMKRKRGRERKGEGERETGTENERETSRQRQRERTATAQVNEIVADLTIKKKDLDKILEAYLSVYPRCVR
jgi:hypothetical protein